MEPTENKINTERFPSDISDTKTVPTVALTAYDRDVSKAKSKGFVKGFLTAVVIAIIGAGTMYLISGFGNQYQYKLLEPDFDAPELKEDILKEEGDIDGGDTDVELIEE